MAGTVYPATLPGITSNDIRLQTCFQKNIIKYRSIVFTNSSAAAQCSCDLEVRVRVEIYTVSTVCIIAYVIYYPGINRPGYLRFIFGSRSNIICNILGGLGIL